jgi:hypothetical protein
MATEDNALTPQEQAKLKAFAQGLPDEPGDIDVDAIAQETGTSRRQVLQVIAAVGVGSIAGGVSVSQLVAEAQAQASTSDNDGNVGTPSDRVDVFSDGIDSNTIDTGEVDSATYIGEEGNLIANRIKLGFQRVDGDSSEEFLPSLSTSEKRGFLSLQAGDNTGLFLLRGADSDVVTISAPDDLGGTSSAFYAIYWSSTNSQYQLENDAGGGRDFGYLFHQNVR